jgi:hypothetical protein
LGKFWIFFVFNSINSNNFANFLEKVIKFLISKNLKKKNSKSHVWNANLALYFTLCDYKFHVNVNVNIVSYLQSSWFIHKSRVWMQISTLYLLVSYKFLIHSFTLACVNASLMWMQMLTTYFKFTKFMSHSHILCVWMWISHILLIIIIHKLPSQLCFIGEISPLCRIFKNKNIEKWTKFGSF